MIEMLATSNVTWWLAAIAVVVVGANIAFGMKVLNSINSDPSEKRGSSPLADPIDAAESNGYRTNVAAPRPRRLQPPTSAAEPPMSNVPAISNVPAMSNVPEAAVAALPRPIKLGVPAPKEPEMAEPVLASAASSRNDEKPADLPLKNETPVPIGALVLGGLATEASLPAATAGPAAGTKTTAAPASPATLLPAMPPTAKLEEVPTTGRKFFEPVTPTAPLTASANLPVSLDETKKGVTLPPLFPKELIFDGGKKAAEELAAAVPSAAQPPADLTALKTVETTPIIPAPEPETPKTESVGEDLPAASGLVKSAGGIGLPAIPAEEADDVKKKTPRTPAPEPAARAGLILLPPVEAKAEPASAKLADSPAEPAAKTEALPTTEKAALEPVLPPAAADVPPTAKPEGETKAVKGPRVFLPGKFFGKGKDKEAAVEAKAAKETARKAAEAPPVPAAPAESAKVEPEAPKITTPASAPALIVPPVEEVPAVIEAREAAPETGPASKADEKPVAKPDEPKVPEPAAKTVETPAVKELESGVPEPVKPAIELPADEAPAEPASEEVSASKAETGPASKTEPEPAPEAKAAPEKPADSTEPAPKVEPAAPAAEKAAEPVPAAEKAPEPTAPAAPAEPTASLILPPVPVQEAAPAAESTAEPLVPMLIPAPVPEKVLVEAKTDALASPEVPVTSEHVAATPPAASAVPIIPPQPVMPENETNTSLPNSGRASAQLTLGFEITSLQLTPFFKLGSVQLKALSNVVSLHLVAAQADNPLAAGISFQIDHVELDNATHLKSILLKPLGESRTITAPLPKLQVDNVAVSGGGEGAPISVTTSGAASTAVQLFGTFTIAAMEFTPAFEIGSLRLEPTSNTVLLRVAPSSRPTALDLPPSFEVAAVQLGDGAQISGMRLTPGKAS